MKAFLTGSRAYGTPRIDSDIDLVIFTDVETAGLLQVWGAVENAAPQGSDEGSDEVYGPIRFGKLNLIVCTSEEAYRAWVDGTAELKKRAPCSREEAKTVFLKLREAYCGK
jgi:Nucleotidyltransferase domain